MSFNLQTVENELKEHAKVTARNALTEERQQLAEMLDYLKALESGATIQEAEAHLEKVTAQIKAKIENMKDNVQSEIAKMKLAIENSLERIEEHKAISRAPSQTASAPAAGVVATSNGSPAPAPALAANPTPAPATLDDAGVTTPTPPPAAVPTTDGSSQS